MCCFSKSVTSVTATNIFARTGEDGRQFLVYSMSIVADQDLAMILPLPVPDGADEKAVEFINLKDYPDFFGDMVKGFLVADSNRGLHLFETGAASASMRPLEVVQVGDFEASFVPTEKDFERLDERFRLPSGVWSKLPGYKEWGFAVFKLKSGAARIHPMAFSFPRRDMKTLFFPTVHIHDGKVHATADFDHVLYCQPRENQHLGVRNWEESVKHARSFVKVARTKGIVEADQHCYQKEMHGELPNRDTFVSVEG